MPPKPNENKNISPTPPNTTPSYDTGLTHLTSPEPLWEYPSFTLPPTTSYLDTAPSMPAPQSLSDAMQAILEAKKVMPPKPNQNKNISPTPPNTTPSYDTGLTHLTSPEPLWEYPSFTLPPTTSYLDTAPSMPAPQSLSDEEETTSETPYWLYLHADEGTSTPSTFTFTDVMTPEEIIYFEDTTVSSSDVTISSSGDETTTGGSVLSGDTSAMPYDDPTMTSGTVVMDDDLAVLIPTVNSDYMTDLHSPWSDLPEYIPVSITTSDLITAPPPTTTEQLVHTTMTSTVSPRSGAGEFSENNSVDIPYGRIVGVDHDISQSNLIARRRINLRERTRNKRIQELLEEKRNFLLRMKRGQPA